MDNRKVNSMRSGLTKSLLVASLVSLAGLNITVYAAEKEEPPERETKP